MNITLDRRDARSHVILILYHYSQSYHISEFTSCEVPPQAGSMPSR